MNVIPLGDHCETVGFGTAWRLAVENVSPGDSCYISGQLELVRLTAIWELVVLGGTCPPPGDFAVATLGCWFCRRDLQGFWCCFKGGIAGVP
ncbi:hypothetical protein DEO72_LG11g1342 [Vigna unguiculata]|uniref:Uncharacterized protein n=1 Tax=Vigna unguiculata TaxID=3917 RepID=A0A4D6NKM3_VIGUN|nr:hypothetical protein DEO72_LG11g1342 [Vigna unguiculata]